jgi:nucleotide-binding universal stress UspA family protein
MSALKKILIAYDGSSCAEAALDDLRRAGLPSVCEVLVLTVTEFWLPAPLPSGYEIFEACALQASADFAPYSHESPALVEAQSMAEAAAKRLRSNFPKWNVSAEACIGSPSRELIAKADAWGPDLLVVGSHGRSVFGRIILGSVSQSVLTHAHCSVRIARGRVEEPNTPVRIVVGVDGSPASAAAIREVGMREWPQLSEIRVIAVTAPLTTTFAGTLMPPVGRIVQMSNDAEREWLNSIVQDAAGVLEPSGLKVSTEIREGDPKHELIEAAEAWNADCLFVGSVGFSNRFERFLLGSVSASVTARAHCSVEVVRPPKSIGGISHDPQFEYSRN